MAGKSPPMGHCNEEKHGKIMGNPLCMEALKDLNGKQNLEWCMFQRSMRLITRGIDHGCFCGRGLFVDQQ